MVILVQNDWKLLVIELEARNRMPDPDYWVFGGFSHSGLVLASWQFSLSRWSVKIWKVGVDITMPMQWVVRGNDVENCFHLTCMFLHRRPNAIFIHTVLRRQHSTDFIHMTFHCCCGIDKFSKKSTCGNADKRSNFLLSYDASALLKKSAISLRFYLYLICPCWGVHILVFANQMRKIIVWGFANFLVLQCDSNVKLFQR